MSTLEFQENCAQRQLSCHNTSFFKSKNFTFIDKLVFQFKFSVILISCILVWQLQLYKYETESISKDTLSSSVRLQQIQQRFLNVFFSQERAHQSLNTDSKNFALLQTQLFFTIYTKQMRSKQKYLVLFNILLYFYSFMHYSNLTASRNFLFCLSVHVSIQ